MTVTKSLETLRYATAPELFAALPEMIEDMEARPQPDEPILTFAWRLLDSPTPEEAITCAAQMFVRRVSIWWGHECLRHLAERLDPIDLDMMRRVADWVAQPDSAPVRPPHFLAGRGVNAAILTALARVPQARRKATLHDFLSMAQDLAA